MIGPVRLLTAVAVAVALSAAVATATAAPSPARAMHVTIDITGAGAAEAATPANFAVRSGGTVTLTFRNHTNLFHTFTVRALGISVLLRPMRATSVTFVAPYGVYVWRCVICSTAAHPRAHAMRGNMYAIVDV